MVFFTGDDSNGAAKNSSAHNLDGSPNKATAQHTPQLPPILSVVRRQSKEFRMPVQVKHGVSFSQAKCSSYFNGTLHVTGRQTTQNLFHVSKYSAAIYNLIST